MHSGSVQNKWNIRRIILVRLWKGNKNGEKYQQGKLNIKDSKNWKSNQQKPCTVWAIDSRAGRASQKAESDTKWGVIESNWNKQQKLWRDPEFHSGERWGRIGMEEYSRIIIEEYCMNHPKTQKADFLWEMVHMSYDIACEPEPWQLMHLSQLISRERNPELRDALEDLDEFMNGY